MPNGTEGCNEVFFEITERYYCLSGQFIDQTEQDIYEPIPGCGEDDDDDWPPEETDCAGDVNGSAYMADCGCIGGSTGIYECPPEEEDCNGVPGGSAYMADCGCIGGNTGIYECPPLQTDCNGDEGGTAYLDACQTCVGGNTGKTVQTWYQDFDADGWGSSVTKQCFDPGPGWILQGGDLNDNCYNLANITGQCCDSQAQAQGTSSSTLYNKSAVQTQIGNLGPIGDPLPEQGFSIRKNTDGSYIATPIQTLGPTGGMMNNYLNSVANLHTHPSSSPPSAKDIKMLHDLRSQIPGFITCYVKTASGVQYAISITDFAAFDTFISNNPNLVAPDNGFQTGSVVGVAYQNGINSFFAQGFSLEDAVDHATAFVLNEASVMLLRTEPGSNTFKKIGAEKKLNPDGTEAVDSNGKKIYTKSDCQ